MLVNSQAALWVVFPFPLNFGGCLFDLPINSHSFNELFFIVLSKFTILMFSLEKLSDPLHIYQTQAYAELFSYIFISISQDLDTVTPFYS